MSSVLSVLLDPEYLKLEFNILSLPCYFPWFDGKWSQSGTRESSCHTRHCQQSIHIHWAHLEHLEATCTCSYKRYISHYGYRLPGSLTSPRRKLFGKWPPKKRDSVLHANRSNSRELKRARKKRATTNSLCWFGPDVYGVFLGLNELLWFDISFLSPSSYDISPHI